jgi:hypothetical protein
MEMNQMTQKLRMLATLLLLPSLVRWLWQGRQRVEPPVEVSAAGRTAAEDEARFFEAEWREAEETALAALQELGEAYETIGQLQLAADNQWQFTRELLLLNACGYYGNVRFDYDDRGEVRGVYLSQHDRIRFVPASDLDDSVPPLQWSSN